MLLCEMALVRAVIIDDKENWRESARFTESTDLPNVYSIVPNDSYRLASTPLIPSCALLLTNIL